MVGPAVTCGRHDFYSVHSWPYSKKTRSPQFSRIRSRCQLSAATTGLPTQKLWLSASGAEYCEDGPIGMTSRPGPGIQESAEQGCCHPAGWQNGTVGMTGRPRRTRERIQPPRLRLWRQSLPISLPGPVKRRPFHPASLRWEDLGLTAAQCLPGPTDLNTIDHAVVIGADEVTSRRDVTTHQGPVTRLDVDGVGSGPGPHLREGPALEPGTLTRRMLRGLVVLRGGRRRSGLFSSATHHQRHHSRSSPDRRSRAGSQHHDRWERVDSVQVCWVPVGPPALSRTGWASFSFKDLSSPISASASGPGTAVETSSRPWMPCC